MKEKSKERLKALLKVLVSIVLITVIIWRIGPRTILDELLAADPSYFLLAIGLTIFNVMLSAKKWHILLTSKEGSKSFLQLWKLYYIGTFFNLFLPTTVGGDIVRAHKTSKISKHWIEGYSSVFMERFTGMIAIVILATISGTLYYHDFPRSIMLTIYVIFVPLILISFFLIYSDRFIAFMQRLLKKIFKNFNPFSVKEKSIKMLTSINQYAHMKKLIVCALVLSLLFHSMLIISYYLLAISLGLTIPLYYFFVFIPVSHVILLLPISIRGFGVREVIYVSFFTQVGATGAEAVSLSLLVQILGITSSLIGGAVYLHSKLKKVKEVDEL